MSDSLSDFFAHIGSIPTDQLNSLASKTHSAVFERTDCLSCGNCCKSAPPVVTDSDIGRIAKHLKISTKQVKKNYVLEDFNGEKSFDTIPCHFLGADNYCSIYEARPEACRDYPHTNSGNFKQRRRLHLKNVAICPAVNEILDIMMQKIKQDYH